jgi:hypothetical protein
MTNQMPPPPRDPWPHWGYREEEETWWYTAARLSTRTNVVITPPTGSVGLQGHSAIFAIRAVAPAAVPRTKAPWRLSSWVARIVMSKTSYRTQWEPLIVALHDEYYECLDSGDVWGARRAVVRHYVVSIPKWAWVFCYEALKYWAKTHGIWPI